MKALTKPLRRLTAVCLAVIMVISLFTVSASAENTVNLKIYFGTDAIHGGTNFDQLLDNPDLWVVKADPNKPLNQADALKDFTCPRGVDIVGWEAWLNIYDTTSHFDSKPLSLDGDVILSELDEEDLAAAFEKFDPDWHKLANLVFVPKFEKKYWFTDQPTKAYPYADTNVQADGYQWYKRAYENYAVVKKDRDDLKDNEFNAGDVYAGSYDDNTGLWKSEGYSLGVTVELMKGETLIVEVSEGFDGKVLEYFDNDVFTKNGNVYTYTSNTLGKYEGFDLYICNATVGFEVKLTAAKSSWELVSGQTDKVYTGEKTTVMCAATFEGGKYVIESNAVTLGDYYITQQPTSNDPTFKVNTPADVEDYQWYSVEDVTGKYIFSPDDNEAGLKIKTDEYTDPDFEWSLEIAEEFVASDRSFILGEYKGEGEWAPVELYGGETYTSEMIINAQSGGKLTIDLLVSDELQAVIDGDDGLSLEDMYTLMVMPITEENIYSDEPPAPLIPDDDGVYTVDEDVKYLSITFITETEGFTLKPVYDTAAPRLTTVDGQTKATFDGESGTYIVKATMKDETVLTSKRVTVVATSTGDDSTGVVSPPTGDNFSATPWVVMMMLCGAAFVFSVKKLRKE